VLRETWKAMRGWLRCMVAPLRERASGRRSMSDSKRLMAAASLAAVAILCGLTAGTAPAQAAIIKCQPDEVAVWSNRIHVRCEAAVAGVSYFAVPVSDAAHAARMLSVISTAVVAGRAMLLTYEPSDTSGTSIGCPISNCRLLQGAAFGK
jgi:hypothetical protein